MSGAVGIPGARGRGDAKDAEPVAVAHEWSDEDLPLGGYVFNDGSLAYCGPAGTDDEDYERSAGREMLRLARALTDLRAAASAYLRASEHAALVASELLQGRDYSDADAATSELLAARAALVAKLGEG